MHRSQGFLSRYALIIGIILMFVFSWPTMLASAGLLRLQLPFIVGLFAGWGVLVASLLMTWLTLGGAAVGQLLRRYLMWRVGWKWYLALLIIPAAAALGVWLNALITGTSVDWSHVTADNLRPPGFSRLAFVIPFLLVDLINNGEEIGWRGYVLPRLQSKSSALVAALVVGVIWGLWHLPKFLDHWDWGYFALFMIDATAKSILLAWIYNGTRGSLLLAALAHSAWNTAGVFLPSATTLSTEGLGAFAAQVALEVVIAIVIVALAGAADLSRTEQKQVQA